MTWHTDEAQQVALLAPSSGTVSQLLAALSDASKLLALASAPAGQGSTAVWDGTSAWRDTYGALALGETVVPYLQLGNTTPADAADHQWSPALRLLASRWTGAAPVTDYCDILLKNFATSGAALSFRFGGTEKLYVNSSGLVLASSDVVSSGDIKASGYLQAGGVASGSAGKLSLGTATEATSGAAGDFLVCYVGTTKYKLQLYADS